MPDHIPFHEYDRKRLELIRDAIQEDISRYGLDSITRIVLWAGRLKGLLYELNTSLTDDERKALFGLRKSLEGIFGHEVPGSEEIFEAENQLLSETNE